MDKLKILVCPANDGGCAYYRAWAPFQKLLELYPEAVDIRFDKNPLGIVETGDKSGSWEEDWGFDNMKWADVIFCHNIANWGGSYTGRIIGKAKEFGKFVHYDTDDLLTDLYDGHRLKEVYEKQGLSENTKFFYANSDLVTVTQIKFAERIREFCSGVLAVVKNAIDYGLDCWNMPKQRSPRKRFVRVGWAGGIHHEEDVKEFAGIPHFVNQRVGRENVSWDFYGKPPLQEGMERDWQHDVWDNYERILMKGFKGGKNYNIFNALPSDHYGAIYSRMDVAIAPLQMNPFNDSKSEIKVAECGRYSVPLIASNVGCYSETIQNGNTGYLIEPNAPKAEWVKVLTRVIKDKAHRDKMGTNLNKLSDLYFDLNKVAVKRLELYRECFKLRGYDELYKKLENYEQTISKNS